VRVVVTGGNGQLGQSLEAACRRAGAAFDFVCVDQPQWDITDPSQVEPLTDLKPAFVIHCAAMTDVDGCARDPDLAFKVNAFGTQNVALACRRAGAAMVYVSTNEVFAGNASQPYREFDATGAVNAYGASKLAGEIVASRLLQELYIVRVAWLYSAGDNNFVSKILARAHRFGQLKVVVDEVANPTFAPDAAAAMLQLVETGHFGIYHLVNEGHCSRFEFAQEILRLGGRADVPVEPISSREFQRASTPPAFSALRNTMGAALGIQLRPWQAALEECLEARSPE
jgi:dTDP-4-dehydrorhamnose reductase